MTAGLIFRLILGVILTIITYRGVMLCVMEEKLDIPLYPVAVIAVCTIATGCSLIGYVMLVYEDYVDKRTGCGCLQVFISALCLVCVLISAIPVFYAELDSRMTIVLHATDTFDGEITAVSEPEEYPRVIPFFPKVVRYDCDYKYYDGPIGRADTKTYTGSFNTTVEYKLGDEVTVLKLPANPFLDKFVFENLREISKDLSYEIAVLIVIYILLLVAFVTFGRAHSTSDDTPEPDDD